MYSITALRMVKYGNIESLKVYLKNVVAADKTIYSSALYEAIKINRFDMALCFTSKGYDVDSFDKINLETTFPVSYNSFKNYVRKQKLLALGNND